MDRISKYHNFCNSIDISEIKDIREIIISLSLPIELFYVASSLYYRYVFLNKEECIIDASKVTAACIILAGKILEIFIDNNQLFTATLRYFENSCNECNEDLLPDNYTGILGNKSWNESINQDTNERKMFLDSFQENVKSIEVKICFELKFDLFYKNPNELFVEYKKLINQEHVPGSYIETIFYDSCYLPLNAFFSEKKILKACHLIHLLIKDKTANEKNETILFICNEILDLYIRYKKQ